MNAKIKRRYVPYKYSDYWNRMEENGRIYYSNMMQLLIVVNYCTF